MNVYKINDVISCEFLKIPKTMFANEEYRKLSSDTKLAYALLYDRLSLSKLNGWINEDDEVYLIYTREEIAQDLGITYKKAISAFKELIVAGLITEKRCGRGMANRIYIVKLDLTEKQAKKYVKRENLRTAESAYQEISDNEPRNCQNSISEENPDCLDVPNEHIKNCENGISKPADTEVQELPKQHPNKTYDNQIYNNQIENSQSVSYGKFPLYLPEEEDGQTDDIYSLDEIIENCQLEFFDAEERKILYDAIERLFYSKSFKIGNAVLPQAKVRSRLYELDATTLQSAMHNLHQNKDRPIKNMTSYVMSTIFNCITEDYTLLHVDPFLNSMREVRRE